MTEPLRCPCNSGEIFENCCKPFLDRAISPNTPEQLMRSRYTAYHQNNFKYIYDTYVAPKQAELTIESLSTHSTNTNWVNLTVNGIPKSDQVDFTATYQEGKQFFQLHECSTFIIENGCWRYQNGEIFTDSGEIHPGRNDKCPCKSNIKFKKCCGK